MSIAIDDPELMDRLRAAFADKLFLTRKELAPVLRMSVDTLGDLEDAGQIASRRRGLGTIRPRRMYAFEDVISAKFLKKVETPQCPSIVPQARSTSFSTSGAEVVGFTALRERRLKEKLGK